MFWWLWDLKIFIVRTDLSPLLVNSIASKPFWFLSPANENSTIIFKEKNRCLFVFIKIDLQIRFIKCFCSSEIVLFNQMLKLYSSVFIFVFLYLLHTFKTTLLIPFNIWRRWGDLEGIPCHHESVLNERLSSALIFTWISDVNLVSSFINFSSS